METRPLQKLTLIISGDSNEGSHNKRTHWRAAAKMKQRWRTKARLLAIAAWGSRAPMRGIVRVTFVVRRPRFLDPDNARSSSCLKCAIDSMVDAGILRGDTVACV